MADKGGGRLAGLLQWLSRQPELFVVLGRPGDFAELRLQLDLAGADWLAVVITPGCAHVLTTRPPAGPHVEGFRWISPRSALTIAELVVTPGWWRVETSESWAFLAQRLGGRAHA